MNILIGLLFVASGLGFQAGWRMLAPTDRGACPIYGYALFWVWNLLVAYLAIAVSPFFSALALLGLSTLPYWNKEHWLRMALLLFCFFVGYFLPLNESDSIGYTLPMVDGAIKAQTLGVWITENTRSISRLWGLEGQILNLLLLCKGSAMACKAVAPLGIMFGADCLSYATRVFTKDKRLLRFVWIFGFFSLPFFTAATVLKSDVTFGACTLFLLTLITRKRDLLNLRGLLLGIVLISAKLFYPIAAIVLIVFAPWKDKHHRARGAFVLGCALVVVFSINAARLGGNLAAVLSANAVATTATPAKLHIKDALAVLIGTTGTELGAAERPIYYYSNEEVIKSFLARKKSFTVVTPSQPPTPSVKPAPTLPRAPAQHGFVHFPGLGVVMIQNILTGTISQFYSFLPRNAIYWYMTSSFGILSVIMLLGGYALCRSHRSWIVCALAFSILMSFPLSHPNVNNFRYLFFPMLVLFAAGFGQLSGYTPTMQRACYGFIVGILGLGLAGYFLQPTVSESLQFYRTHGRPPYPAETRNLDPHVPYVPAGIWTAPHRFLITGLNFSPQFLFTDSSQSQFSETSFAWVKAEKVDELGAIAQCDYILVGFDWNTYQTNLEHCSMGSYMPWPAPWPDTVQWLKQEQITPTHK